jgi:hypothetical protein
MIWMQKPGKNMSISAWFFWAGNRRGCRWSTWTDPWQNRRGFHRQNDLLGKMGEI